MSASQALKAEGDVSCTLTLSLGEAMEGSGGDVAPGHLSVRRFADTAHNGKRAMWSSHAPEVPTCKDGVTEPEERARNSPEMAMWRNGIGSRHVGVSSQSVLAPLGLPTFPFATLLSSMSTTTNLHDFQ